ncbi:MAG: endo alpha-1,4 polygalactosaminidase [Polyangiaceae bacterium]
MTRFVLPQLMVYPCLLAALAGCDGTTGDLVTRVGSPPAGQGDAGQGNVGAAGGAEAESSWQIQLSGTLDASFDVSVYEADLFALDAEFVRAVHVAGHSLTCYVSVGTAEPWRSDYDTLPAAAIGSALADYPQEHWLDVRDEGVRRTMTARIAIAARTGCDAVELSNLGAHTTDSGFPLTQADDLDYARSLIEACHSRGLTGGISGSDDLVPRLATVADWGLTEECLAYDSCATWQAFTAQSKRVFMIEYGSTNDAPTLCAEAAKLGFSLVIKRRALDSFRVGCASKTMNP